MFIYMHGMGSWQVTKIWGGLSSQSPKGYIVIQTCTSVINGQKLQKKSYSKCLYGKKWTKHCVIVYKTKHKMHRDQFSVSTIRRLVAHFKFIYQHCSRSGWKKTLEFSGRTWRGSSKCCFRNDRRRRNSEVFHAWDFWWYRIFSI